MHMPFKDFQVDVLREFNVTPTQLHLNTWTVMQTFDILCKALGLTPTPTLFLHHYRTCLIAQKGVSFFNR